MKLCAEKPCPTCPWRKESTVGGDDIPNFSLDRMKGLVSTVPERGSDSDGFFKIMACHHSKDGLEFACAGYAAIHGLQNINFRLFLAQNNIDFKKIEDNCKGIALYDNFYTMLDDYVAAHENGDIPTHCNI